MNGRSDATTPTFATFEPGAKSSVFRRPVLGALSGMKAGRLRLQTPEGACWEFGDGQGSDSTDRPGEAAIMVRREAFFRKCFWSGDIGFAESFIDGDWETPDLTAVISWFVLNVEHAPTLSGSNRRRAFGLNLLQLANRVGHLLRPNTRSSARRNIREHYDLSNNFFSLFLDPSMMYSAARWPAGQSELSLEAAQREKNDALCRRLQLRATDHVLEIGCGWGAWSLHAARTYGCRVTAVTISQEQFDFARRRIADAGLTGRVDVQLRDFRDLTGQFDKIVSIEMMEALGHRFLPVFAATLDRLLKRDGLLALQFITCPDDRYERLRRGVDFIQKHVFPGSLLLSLNRVNEQLSRRGGFVTRHVEDFGPDYARTLRLWHDTFLNRLDQVRALGFDERFIRKWTYYLCYCEGAFAMRNISVVHTLHSRANNRAV